MFRLKTPAALGLALVLPFSSGCILDKFRDKTPQPPTATMDRKPDAPSLVNYLNQNAQKVQSVRAKVDIDCKQGRQSVGLGGRLACQKPRDFRLKADVLGKPAVDIGSNNDEFWYWISQASPPYVYHCAYNDLASGKINLPFPFHPDMVVAALGMAEFDTNAHYELRETARTVEMIQDGTSSSGEKVKRITVFNRFQAKSGEPQVLGHVLQDLNGKPICRATVHKVTVDRASGAVVPTSVTIEWPAQELSMKLYLSDVQTNALDKTSSARLFLRTDLTGHESFDLARGTVDGPGGTRRASGTTLPVR
ncbi:MAG: hypothetical protein U0840_25250 [Gemmataceae bacterium]